MDRAWLDTALPGKSTTFRDDLAAQFDCDPSEVEARLDARDRMDAYIAERREYDEPIRMASSTRRR